MVHPVPKITRAYSVPQLHPFSWKKGSAGFQPVGAGILPATRTRVGIHGLVMLPRAIRSRQDAGCGGQDGRAPLLSTASFRLMMTVGFRTEPQPRLNCPDRV
jgi:hypothetical protein